MSRIKHVAFEDGSISSCSKLSSSMVAYGIEKIFSISELVYIDYINKYFHELTPNKNLHIATICTNLFGRLIDVDMISYTISLFKNGFFPCMDSYNRLHEYLIVSRN